MHSLPRPVLGLLAAGGAALMMSCVPSIPLCNCGDDGGTGGGVWPDQSALDRSADCQLDDSETCGYPAGPYNPVQGETFPNIVVENCAGEAVEFAQLLNERPDTASFNRGVVFAFGAGWCAPCIEESEHFGEIAPDYRTQDIEFLTLIIEGATNGSPADMSLCDQWDTTVSNMAYPIWYTPDPAFSMGLLPPGTSIPYLFMVNANGKVTYAIAGKQNDSVIDAQIQNLISNPYG